MKQSSFLVFSFLLVFLITSCSKNINYSQEHIKQTSGRYLYNSEEVIDVYYDTNELFLKWKGSSKIKPVVLDENTFFVADMYQKLRFVKHPETNKRYLGVVAEDDDSKVTYAYEKVDDNFKTPWMYVQNEEFKKATEAYLTLREQDTTNAYIQEHEINRIGYNLLGEKKYDKAIAAFQMNVALYPDSDNVYDSLADAYMRSGDTIQAVINYKKALEHNTGNERAKEAIKKYGDKVQ